MATEKELLVLTIVHGLVKGAILSNAVSQRVLLSVASVSLYYHKAEKGSPLFQSPGCIIQRGR
jgi:hypothetical protein